MQTEKPGTKSLMRSGLAPLALVLGLAAPATMGCASVGWTEERGAPVAISYAENYRANDQFLEGLADRRKEEPIPDPIVTPALQPQLRVIAEMLQAGQISVAEAQRASQRWGRKAYHRNNIDAWVLDCGHGRNMSFPSALVHRPTAVITYAAAYHKPPTVSSPQCAMLIVSPNGPEVVSTAFDRKP